VPSGMRRSSWGSLLNSTGFNEIVDCFNPHAASHPRGFHATVAASMPLHTLPYLMFYSPP